MYMRFASYVKPSADMKCAMADASRLMLGVEGERVAKLMETGVIRVPSESILRQSRVRLDMCNM